MGARKARKKFRECGHINYGKSCPRCKWADRVEAGFTSEANNKRDGIVYPPDAEEAARLRLPTNSTAKRRRNNFPGWKQR